MGKAMFIYALITLASFIILKFGGVITFLMSHVLIHRHGTLSFWQSVWDVQGLQAYLLWKMNLHKSIGWVVLYSTAKEIRIQSGNIV